MKKITLAAIVLLITATFSSLSFGQTISTYAGNGVGSYTGDGVAASTTAVNSPWGVTIDSAGNVYIGDSPNHRIRKVTPAGIISTIAGTGTMGFLGDGGPATDARLNNPSGVAVDAAGNVYVADNGNHRIRKITATGYISTIAGTGSVVLSGDGGPATAAATPAPDGLACDSAGNVYISSGFEVRKITTTGMIYRIAGNGTFGYSGDGGPATAAAVAQSTDVKLDKAGNVYFTDINNNVARKIDVAGIITTIAGDGYLGSSGDGGPATAAELNSVVGIDVDALGNVYLGDRDNNTIRKVNAAGIITTIAGNGAAGYSGDGGAPVLASLKKPHAITHDPCGNMFICDRLNNRIRKIADPTIIYAGTITGIDSVCPGDSVHLNNIITTGAWSISDTTRGHFSTAGNFKGILPGLDTVRYIVNYYCGTDTATKVIKIRTAATCALQETAIRQVGGTSVFPNPTTGQLTVIVHAVANDDVRITVSNMLGQQVKTMLVPVNKPAIINLDVPPGIYQVSVTVKDRSEMYRVVVTAK